jgi:hypothetical protein
MFTVSWADTFTAEQLEAMVEEALAEAQAEVTRRDEVIALLEQQSQARGKRLREMTRRESELGNALVGQKNQLLDLVNAGEYETALQLLAFVAGLWQASGYGYKTGEVLQRIRGDAKVDLERLGPRQRKERARLEAVLERVEAMGRA